MSDLAPARSAQRSRLTDRERRKVVVVHVPLGGLVGETVDLLRVAHRAQGRDRQRLGLSTCEQARAVRAWQHPDLNRDVPDILEASAVDADALFDYALANPVLERLVEKLSKDLDMLRKPLAQLD